MTGQSVNAGQPVNAGEPVNAEVPVNAEYPVDTGQPVQAGEPMSGSALLEVSDLVVYHGQLKAIDQVSFRVLPGEVYAFIGANGAGKSTLLRTIAGLHRPSAGSIRFDGNDVTRLRPERRATAGLGMVPEGRRLFPSLTLEENLLVGASYARKGEWDIERVYELFPWMRERRNQRTEQMSGGEQQSVAIGRALVANPRVLLLDELSLGLAPVVVQRIYAMLPQILATGLTAVIVEQDVSQALRVASHVHCLLEGRTTLQGTPAQVTAAQVEAAYFGLAQDPLAQGSLAQGSLAQGSLAQGSLAQGSLAQDEQAYQGPAQQGQAEQRRPT
jgi:branched-chain amino acid transport system ATP-binding protein